MSRRRGKSLEDKRKEAEARNEAWAELSPAEQLRQLDLRLGPGKGATKQRQRLLKRIREK